MVSVVGCFRWLFCRACHFEVWHARNTGASGRLSKNRDRMVLLSSVANRYRLRIAGRFGSGGGFALRFLSIISADEGRFASSGEASFSCCLVVPFSAGALVGVAMPQRDPYRPQRMDDGGSGSFFQFGGSFLFGILCSWPGKRAPWISNRAFDRLSIGSLGRIQSTFWRFGGLERNDLCVA